MATLNARTLFRSRYDRQPTEVYGLCFLTLSKLVGPNAEVDHAQSMAISEIVESITYDNWLDQKLQVNTLLASLANLAK